MTRGRRRGRAERHDDVAHPPDLVAERVEDAQPGQAPDEDARRSAHAGKAIRLVSRSDRRPRRSAPRASRSRPSFRRRGATGASRRSWPRGVAAARRRSVVRVASPGPRPGVPNGAARDRALGAPALDDVVGGVEARRPAAPSAASATGLVVGERPAHRGLHGEQPAAGVLAAQDEDDLLRQPRQVLLAGPGHDIHGRRDPGVPDGQARSPGTSTQIRPDLRRRLGEQGGDVERGARPARRPARCADSVGQRATSSPSAALRARGARSHVNCVITRRDGDCRC